MFKYCLIASLLLACGHSNVDSGIGTGGAGGYIVPQGTGGRFSQGDGGIIPLDGGEINSLLDAACANNTVDVTPAESVLQLVVDDSSSMNQVLSSTTPNSKWQVESQSMISALGTMSDTTSVGILFFPGKNVAASTTNVGFCLNTGVLIAPAALSTTRTTITNLFGTIRTFGGTPTEVAYAYGLSNGLLTSTLPGKKFMLLMTDGEPNISYPCIGANNLQPVPTQPIINRIATAYNTNGILTFVIGAPGSDGSDSSGIDSRPWLSDAAVAGGTSIAAGCSNTGIPEYCHFDLTQSTNFSTDLNAALAKISGQIVTCSYVVPTSINGKTVDTTNINIIVQSSSESYLVLKSDSGTCSQGWTLNSGTINLCADTCSAVKTDSTASVKILYGCVTIINPPLN